jgi:hypothetical protein
MTMNLSPAWNVAGWMKILSVVSTLQEEEIGKN